MLADPRRSSSRVIACARSLSPPARNSRTSGQGVSLAVMVVVVGGYDEILEDGLDLPHDVRGFFYVDGEVAGHDVEMLERKGWDVVPVELCEGNEFVSSARLTTKKVKWGAPSEIREFDVVLTHDGSVRVDYAKLGTFVSERFCECDALFKNNPGSSSVFDEIDEFFEIDPSRVQDSAANIRLWRQHLLDVGYTDQEYFELDMFLFSPSSLAFKRTCDYILQRCHEIQRDQFVAPYALREGGCDYVSLDQSVFESELGYRSVKSRLRAN